MKLVQFMHWEVVEFVFILEPIIAVELFDDKLDWMRALQDTKK